MRTKGKIIILMIAAATTLNAQNPIQQTRSVSPILLYNGNTLLGTAENYYPQKIRVYGTLGYQSLMFHHAGTRSKGDLGFGGGFSYGYNFTRNWGLSLGVDYNHYCSSFKTNIVDESQLMDYNGTVYGLRQVVDAKEKQIAGYLSVPVMATFSTPIARRWDLNAGLGVAMMFPVHSSNKMLSGTVTRTAYWNDVVFSAPDQGRNETEQNLFKHEGIGTSSSYINKRSDRIFRLGAELRADVGVAFRISEHCLLDMGVYLNYGFTNIKRLNDNVAFGTGYSGVVTSQNIGNVHPLSVGIKAGFTFDFGKKKATKVKALPVIEKYYYKTIDTVYVDRDRVVEKIVEKKVYIPAQVASAPDIKVGYDVPNRCAVLPVNDLYDLSLVEDCVDQRIPRDECPILASFPFPFNVSSLTTQNEGFAPALEELKKDSKQEYLLVGFADKVGSDDINTRIAAERSQNVYKILVELYGIDPDRLVIGVATERHPFSTDELNRRAYLFRVDSPTFLTIKKALKTVRRK